MALVVGVAAALVTGCGSSTKPGERIRGRTLTIYFSGPLHGASSTGANAALNGARLALQGARGRVGRYRIAFKVLDDSTPQSAGWDPNQTTVNARLAAADPTTVGYLGEFNSGASAIAIPLLNHAGIAQVSSGSAAVGLTTAGPGASPGEPEKYYPTGVRTFARVLPTDATQAIALVQIEQARGCQSVFVLHDGEVDGEDTALTFVLTAKTRALHVVGVQEFPRGASDYSSLALSVAGSGADCVVVSAIDERSSVLLTEQLARALPRATIFASGELADSAYTDPEQRGIPTSLDPRVIVLSATLSPASYPAAAQSFLSAYARQYGPPEPPAIFGYAAMQLLLRAVARATDNGRKPADRSNIVAALFSSRRWSSVLGAHRIASSGDITIRRFGVYRVVAGQLAFLEAQG